MQNIRNLLQHKRLRLILCAIWLLFIISCILIVSTLLSQGEENSEPTDDTGQASQRPAQITPPPTDVSGLLYSGNGDGTCTITGMGSCEDTELVIPRKSPDGDIVVAIGAKAFLACERLKSVTVSAEIKHIGDSAFLGCLSLANIEVSRDNEAYCSSNGVLYTKDKKTLLCYPPNRAGERYLLNANTRQIAAFAFYGNQNLQHLLYEKTVDSFRDIKIAEGNSLLSTITVTCNYTVGSKG